MFDDDLKQEELELLKKPSLDAEEKQEPEKSHAFLVEDEQPIPQKDEETLEDYKSYKEKYDNLQAALKEERDMRRKDREKLDGLYDRIMQAKERQELQAQPQRPAAPDYETDPIGYLKWENDQLKGAIVQNQQMTQEQRDFITRQAQHEQIMSAYSQASNIYQQQAPDYQDAKKFLMGQRDYELQVMGFSDPGSRAEILRNEEAAVIRQAFATNINPAEMIYNIAKHRGYKGEEKQKETTQAPNKPRSLSTVRGGAVKPNTMQDKIDKVLAMSDDELMNIPDKELSQFLKKIG